MSDEARRVIASADREMQIARAAETALAAALPVLLNELAQRIEAGYAVARREYDQSRNPYHEGYCDALDIAEQRVRGFAAEVTQ